MPFAPPRNNRLSLLWLLIKLALLIFAVRILLVSPYYIPSTSMLPGLLPGDYILVAKWPYGYSNASLPFGLRFFDDPLLANAPQRGDIVVVQPEGPGQYAYVKRVVGLPGETVRMERGVVHIDGVPVERTVTDDYTLRETPATGCDADRFRGEENGRKICQYPQYAEMLPDGTNYMTLDLDARGNLDDVPAVIVPETAYFLLGDNRDRSADSRVDGAVPQEQLVGRALLIVFSTDGSADWLRPWTWFSAARTERIGAML